jgi:hypothetical protein
MTWLNPVALLGLLALGVPILVHLFGRRVAKRQRFPSLRLLQLVSTTPTARSQPSDILLLLVRCGVVTIAALALAQPRWTTAGRNRQSAVPVRVVIVDTSASMKRLTSDQRTALEHARETGQALLDSAREGMVVQAQHPGANVAGAASWLETRSGMREVVVISDFQRGAVSDGDFAPVPAGVGISLRKIAIPASGDPVDVRDSTVALRIDPATDDVDATWQARPRDSVTLPVTVLASPDDEVATRASITAAGSLFPGAASGHSIALVFPGYPGATELAGQVEPLRQPWQGDFLLSLRRHDLFRNSTNTVPACAKSGGVPLRNGQGVIVATLGAGRSGSAYDLLVFSCAEAGSLAGTALLAAAVAATGQDAPFPELEPTSIPDETLRQWERPPTEAAPRGREETSPDGRWLWLLALALLVVEEWLRRRSPRRDPSAMAGMERQERVA